MVSSTNSQVKVKHFLEKVSFPVILQGYILAIQRNISHPKELQSQCSTCLHSNNDSSVALKKPLLPRSLGGDVKAKWIWETRRHPFPVCTPSRTLQIERNPGRRPATFYKRKKPPHIQREYLGRSFPQILENPKDDEKNKFPSIVPTILQDLNKG